MLASELVDVFDIERIPNKFEEKLNSIHLNLIFLLKHNKKSSVISIFLRKKVCPKKIAIFCLRRKQLPKY